MKKIVSIILTAVLAAALLAVPASAAQSNVDADALQFTAQPTFDGTISEAEWGAPTVSVKGTEATTDEDDAPNAANTYIYFQTEDTVQMSYDLWLRWDAEYFYIGAVVNDVDGFSLPSGGADIWNGDCLQTRIDPDGPNSVMKLSDPAYDYKTTEFDYRAHDFSNDTGKAWGNPKTLINAGFGLVKGTTAQAYDMEAKAVMEGTLLGINVISTSTEDSDSCITTYEVAIPWATIREGYTPAANAVLGMTAVMLNSNGSNFNTFLTWGSGICGGQAKTAIKTCGGSNAVTLSTTTVTPAGTYDTTPTTEEETVEDTTKVAASTTASTTAAEDNAETTKKANDKKDLQDDGISPIVIVLIIVAVIVVAAVVVIVIMKKKKGAAPKDDAPKSDDNKKDE